MTTPTVQQVEQTAVTVEHVGKDVKTVWTKVRAKNAVDEVNWRTVEKYIAYGAGLVASTNGFAQLAMPNSFREVLLAVSAGLVAALHLSG